MEMEIEKLRRRVEWIEAKLTRWQLLKDQVELVGTVVVIFAAFTAAPFLLHFFG
jgi:hypothetical protein